MKKNLLNQETELREKVYLCQYKTKEGKMKYDNSGVRRQDRLLDEESALELLKAADFGFLAMQAEEGGGYGVPLNYVYDESEEVVFLHCAPEGRKLRCIEQEPRVTFTIIGKDCHVVPNKFTEAYKSLVLTCRAEMVKNEEERRRAMRLFVDKLSPNDRIVGYKYVEKSLHRTAIICLHVDHFTGKTKRVTAQTPIISKGE